MKSPKLSERYQKLNEWKDTTKEKNNTESGALVVTWTGDNLMLNRFNLSLLWMLLLSSWPRWTPAESRDAAESGFIQLGKRQKRVPVVSPELQDSLSAHRKDSEWINTLWKALKC